MRISILPPERYPELLKFPILKAALPPPATSIIAVVEDDNSNEILGFWIAQAVIHIEPIYLTEAAQDGGITAVKLLATLLSELAARGEASFYAFTDQPDVVNYLLRLGLVPFPYACFRGINPTLLSPSP